MRSFLERPIEGDWPYLWIDATYVKVREAGRIVSVAVTLAVAVNTDGRREVLGMAIGASEAETFWVDFLRKLKRRGLAGVKLVISDAHEGIKAAVARVFRATWQRCRVHFMRNALAHAGRSGRRVVSAFIATAFAQDDAGAARAQWRQVADQVRPKLPKLAALLDEAEEDILAYMTFPKEHRAKIHSTNPLERLNGEVKRRTEVVGIFPNEAAITRLVGAILLEQNDEWAVQRARYMTLETIAPLREILPHAARRGRMTKSGLTCHGDPRPDYAHHVRGHDRKPRSSTVAERLASASLLPPRCHARYPRDPTPAPAPAARPARPNPADRPLADATTARRAACAGSSDAASCPKLPLGPGLLDVGF